ncbi:MAG: hypothetical protein HY461_00280 [Parcubacteria group bacterium]|nr:hypothetical protein [Parcubacteria group bacterium]
MPKRNQTRLAKALARCRYVPGQLHAVCISVMSARYERHYHPRHAHRRRHMIVDAVLAVALVAVFLFAIYITLFYQRAVQHQQIELAIQPSVAAIASGQALSAKIQVRNNGRQAMLDAYVTIPSSVEFSLAQSQPDQQADGRIPLGTIKPGRQAKVDIEGFVVGETGGSVRINAVLHYRTAGFDQAQTKLVSEGVYIPGSLLELDAHFPESIAANKAFDFEITYANHSPVTNFASVSFVPVFPPGWETISSAPGNDPATDTWTLDSLGSLQSGVIKGRARLRSQTALQAPVKLQVYAAPAGRPLLQDEVAFSLPVFYPRVSLNTRLTPQRAALGETIQAAVEITNGESFDLREAALRFSVNDALVDTSSYGAVFGNGTLIVPLETLVAGVRRQVSVPFPLQKTVNAAKAFGQDRVTFDLHGEFFYTDDAGKTVVIPLDDLSSHIDSDLIVMANARYYSPDGEAIGAGPLPPRAGEKTTYVVFVRLQNQLHPLRDAVVSARVPAGAVWEGLGSVTLGSPVIYDEATRMVRWEVGEVADYKTTFADDTYGAVFQISLTPSADEVSQVLTLLTDIRVEAVDLVTGTRLRATDEPVTNAVAFDTPSISQ